MADLTRARTMITALARIAWSDGHLLPGEAEFFASVIEGLELPPEEAAAAWRAIVLGAREDQPLDASELGRADQEQLLKIGYAMAGADGAVSDEELGAIRVLAASCGIGWKEAIAIIEHPVAW